MHEIIGYCVCIVVGRSKTAWGSYWHFLARTHTQELLKLSGVKLIYYWIIGKFSTNSKLPLFALLKRFLPLV
jgi:hypothetical protein